VLFGYPVAATRNNWLHECLCEAIRNVHGAADAGKRYPTWPKILPDAYRAKLRARNALRDRVRAYDRAIRKLAKPDRDLVLQAVEEENRIADLLSGACECATIDALPKAIHEPVDALFGLAFGLLTDLDVRDQQYAAIYAAAPERMCAFCGTEYFDAPGAPREALDHYLTKSRYPFAAANLRNLVPMGHKCNSSYKLANDLLRCADGSRRVAFDPYNHANVSVLLDDSAPFDGTTENTPRWVIRFAPESPAVPTWDEVFSVRERYRRDHLDPSFANWLGLFGKWARREGLGADTDQALVAALRRYEELWAESGLQDRAFLKAAVFRMLRRHCEAGHQRLMAQLRNLVAPPQVPGPAPAGTGNAA
jgi:hypothetical protein